MGTSTSILCISQHPADTLKNELGVDLANPHIDLFVLASETSIGIQEIRDINKFAQHPPLQHEQKQIIILNADTLTVEAQNALLKLLEEPPEYTQMILCAPHTQSFLDTILSRCHIIRDTNSTNLPAQTGHELLSSLITVEPPARLSLIPGDAKTAEGAVAFCRQLIAEMEALLHTEPTKSHVHNLSILTDCLAHLTANANPTLTLTDTILQLQ